MARRVRDSGHELDLRRLEEASRAIGFALLCVESWMVDSQGNREVSSRFLSTWLGGRRRGVGSTRLLVVRLE
jgi:hypothetical protein